MSHQSPTACQLCDRLVPLTFHHLIPKKVHRRAFFQKNFSREQLNCGILICRACHSGIHRLYDEMHLAKYLNSLDQLQADPQIQRHVQWVAKQHYRTRF